MNKRDVCVRAGVYAWINAINGKINQCFQESYKEKLTRNKDINSVGKEMSKCQTMHKATVHYNFNLDARQIFQCGIKKPGPLSKSASNPTVASLI